MPRLMNPHDPSIQVSFSLPLSTRGTLVDLATAEGASIAQTLRRAIVEYANRRGHPRPAAHAED